MNLPPNSDTHPPADRFEDRLLASILADYDELTAPAAAPARPDVVSPPRRRLRQRGPARPRLALSWGVPALAAAGVAALLLLDSGGASAPTPAGSARTTLGHHVQAPQLNPSQRTLYRLAAKSLSAPAVSGRYAILSEVDTESDEPGVKVQRTSVDDTLTGASITYQTGYGAESPDAPPVLRDGPESDQTAAYYDSLPTDPTALRAVLLATAKQQFAADNADMAADTQANDAANGITTPVSPPPPGPTPTDDAFVYQQASDMLWSPVIGPTLRAALYKVLAGCQDVTVNPNATDPSGQPAIEISQTNSSFGFFATYEDPSTGAVLAQAFAGTGEKVMNDAVYQPATSSDTIPADPYPNG